MTFSTHSELKSEEKAIFWIFCLLKRVSTWWEVKNKNFKKFFFSSLYAQIYHNCRSSSLCFFQSHSFEVFNNNYQITYTLVCAFKKKEYWLQTIFEIENKIKKIYFKILRYPSGYLISIVDSSSSPIAANSWA